MSFYTGVP